MTKPENAGTPNKEKGSFKEGTEEDRKKQAGKKGKISSEKRNGRRNEVKLAVTIQKRRERGAR